MVLNEPLLALAEGELGTASTVHLFSGSADKWSLSYTKPGTCYL